MNFLGNNLIRRDHVTGVLLLVILSAPYIGGVYLISRASARNGAPEDKKRDRSVGVGIIGGFTLLIVLTLLFWATPLSRELMTRVRRQSIPLR